ncbi:MAG: hypothetical protein FJ143_01630 [Deltaproteobacteria bacterium]|nr:hypothetical protein [Deltaproteobacteria bacterium]
MTVPLIALTAALSYALSFILSKRGFKYSTPITITFVSLLIQTVTLFTIVLTVTGIPAVAPFVLMLFTVAGVLQAMVRMLTYIGIEKIGAAVERGHRDLFLGRADHRVDRRWNHSGRRRHPAHLMARR